jgi:hypothetical protein
MVANFGGPQDWLGGFLGAYLVLLLFCFSVFVFQSDVWLIVGLTSLVCCFVGFFGWFLRFNYRYHRKCLKYVSLDKEALWEEKPRAMNQS